LILNYDNKKNVYISNFHCSMAFSSCIGCSNNLFSRCHYSNAIYSALELYC
jgi:hypothetical protein